MKNSILHPCQSLAFRHCSIIMTFLIIFLYAQNNYAQCVASSGSIDGIVYLDNNNNGARNVGEGGIQGILVEAYNASGALMGTSTTNQNGAYFFNGLTDGQRLRLQFSFSSTYSSAILGADNASSVSFVQVPACNIGFGLVNAFEYCNSKSEIITTCFVQGETNNRTSEPTIVGIEYGFNTATPARKFAMHGETGSIWGLAYKSRTQEIFSSAFVKQYSGLKNGHDAIFRTFFNGSMYQSLPFVKLSDLGLPVGTFSSTVEDCNYGAQVGKIGLGGLVISPDEKYLYVINIYNNTLVRIPTVSPTTENTLAYQIPGTDFHAFALKYYNGKIYVGTTVPGDEMKVQIFDPTTGTFSDSGLNIPAGADWDDAPVVGSLPAYWLTDIDFTDEGHMLLSISDRIGHRYCNVVTNRLDEQKGDLMIAFKNNAGEWTIENRTVSGEHFKDDFWIANPSYHQEITTGSIFVLPGTGSVVSSVFDPEINSYSGGLHRYNTTTGRKEAGKELYTRETIINFGKASGFGDIVAVCGLPDVEIGNYVWFDSNENGFQDSNESGVGNLAITLLDTDCNVIATSTTDSRGYYTFNRSNVSGGLYTGLQYYIGVGSTQMQTGTDLVTINNQLFRPTVKNNSFTNINSDAATTACTNGMIGVVTNATNHTFDIGLRNAGDCSLKITKSVISTNALRSTDEVQFQITVLNSGTQGVSNVVIEDILPSTYTFSSTKNINWSANGIKLTATLSGVILPNQSKSINLVLNFSQNQIAQPNYTNEVKVISAQNGFGQNLTYLNSCFDSEEDRFSVATPEICDLALIHKVDKELLIAPQNKVVFTTTVCNQGTMSATGYNVVNYLNPEFDFDPAINKGWVISDDLTKLTYAHAEVLGSGNCKDIKLNLSLKNVDLVSQIVNYSEISTSACGTVAYDFDSTPDINKTNDKGGQPKTSTDNMITDNNNDEDDHDPAFIAISLIDLKLEKTVPSRRAAAGDVVVFNLKVTNQGRNPVSKIKLVDFVPAQTDLVDNTWKLSNGVAEKVIEFDNNLESGESFTTTISCKIHNNVLNPETIRNLAGIREIYDENGIDISNPDFNNQLANLPEDGDEPENKNAFDDDFASTYVVIISPAQYEPCSSCRGATTPNNGQFVVNLKIASKAGETWYVESSSGLYDFSSPHPPVAPTSLENGFILDELPHGHAGHSEYLLRAVHLDGKGFAVRLRNEFGDLEQVEANPGICSFETITLDGQRSLCGGASALYTAKVSIPGATYQWYVDNELIPGVSTPTHIINWVAYAVGNHEIKVAASPGCIAPVVMNVAIGQPDNAAIACIGNFNVSLDGNCSMTITPQMLAVSTLSPLSPYVVMLMDKHGNPIPNATLTAEHAGTNVMAKLIEGCGGNSCWSTITVEDKTPPVSICNNITLPCYKLKEYTGPFETDNCGGPVSNVIVSENITTLTCNNDFVKYVDRVYQATDKFGNKSALCNMRISLERPELDLLSIPGNFTMAAGNALFCSTFRTDANGMPNVSVTGVPTLAGISLYPVFDEICNLAVWYTDVDHGFINCTRKITRSWHVHENWCSSTEILIFKQLIEITDNKPPFIAPISNFEVSTNGHDICEGDVRLPAAMVVDTCSPTIEVDVTYPGGFINDFKNNGTITLPVGTHTIRYTAYDACGNSSFRTFTVVIKDKTAPTVICKGEVVVGLNSNGDAYIYPRNIDDGSFDGCGIDSMKIARMVPNGLIPDSLFEDHIVFKCPDAGKTLMVALRAWDTNGNSNSCMVNVTVQDKHAPKITCPANVAIDCKDVFTGMDLTKYGNALAIDACGATVTELAPKFTLNSCRVGTIERTFRASDSQGNATCTQVITVGNSDTFDPLTDVTKPLDYTVNDRCSVDELKPESLPTINGNPVIRQSACGLAAASYKDDVFNIVTGACYKIVRTWTIIDWCEMDRLGSDYAPYVFQQTIKVNNTVPPFFVGNLPKDTTFLTAKGVCDEGRVTLSYRGRDLCTPENRLRWSYTIDYNNDKLNLISNTGFGPLVSINSIFPTGTHKIVWSFEDQCGNVTSREQIVIVRNNDNPMAVGLERISVAIVPWDSTGDGRPDIEKACIFASSLNTSSVSTCCKTPLRFSFSSNPLDTVRCFDCADVGQDNVVELWVHDCNDNTDFVEIDVDVQDNNDSNVCDSICIRTPLNIIITGSTNICTGRTTTLVASATGATSFRWSTGATTATITVNPAINTTYAVTVTNRFNCTGTSTSTVTVSPLPTATIAGNNICVGGTATLLASGGTSYVWSNAATTAAISVSPNTNTTYTVTVTNANGCTASTSRQVTINPLPTAAVTGNNAICIGSGTTLTATGGGTYLWNNNVTTAAITVNPIVTTTYTVTVTNTFGCTATANRTVTVNGLTIAASVTGTNQICLGQNTTLTSSLSGSTANRYLWSNNASTSAITVSPQVSTTYTVTISDTNGCTATSSRAVTVNPLPTPAIAGSNICVGQSTTLTASGGTSYVWSNNATTAAITVSPATNTTYTVTVTNANNCTASTSRLVTVNPLPVASISGNNSICTGSSTTLTATGGGTYAWSNGASTAAITVNPIATTTYTVTVTSTVGCTSTANRTVTVNGLSISASVTGTNQICIGQSTTLQAALTGSTPTGYIWNTNATTSAITVTPQTSTTYTVTISDTNGCTATANRAVTVNPLPTPAIAGNNICLGQSTTLTASGGASYVWSNAATTAAITVSPAITSTFTVTVTNANGCVASTSRQVVVNPLPNAQITGNTSICIGSNTTLTASGGTSYVWSNSATTAAISVNPIVTTSYTVTVTNSNNCTATSNVTVTVNGLSITASVTGTNQICVGQSTTLQAALTGSTPISYLWNTNATTSAIIVNPVVNTTYTVTITDNNGCTASANRTVTVNPLPTINIAGTLAVCPGSSTTLTASGASTYVWSTGATTAAVTVSPAVATTYTVTATNANGCINTAQRTVTIRPLPTVAISGDNRICVGTSTVLTASGANTYAWSTGATTSAITVSPAITTTYTVTGTDSNGCQNTANVIVTLDPNPVPVITGDMMICVGESTTLTASGGVSYVWNTTATTAAITVSPIVNTTYTVTTTDVNGCVGSNSAPVVVDPGTLTCSTQNITVYLNPLGTVSITPANISTGAVGACANVTATVTPATFNCNDAASNIPIIVTLTVTNTNTNQSLSCTAQVTVLDTLNPILDCPANLNLDCASFDPTAPLSTYGVALASDNCSVGFTLTEVPIIDISDCNVGLITRTFTATDASGNSSQCVQLINVTNFDPIAAPDIDFPDNVTITNCDSPLPASIGSPNLDTDQFTCGDITVTFTDNLPNTLCAGTFQRIWTVTDSCQLVVGTNNGIFTSTQTITVLVPIPNITGPTSFVINRDSMTCEASLSGAALHGVPGCNLSLFVNGVPVTDFNLNGDYEDGDTTFQLVAVSNCDNTKRDTLNFVLMVNGVDESLVCVKTYPELDDQLMAIDNVYDHAVIFAGCDNGATNQNILASFSNTNVNDTTRVYTCVDLIPNMPIGITVYFWYEGASAPHTLCQSLVGLQNQIPPFCITPPTRITGTVQTENAQAVPNVVIALDGSNMPETNTNITGKYEFPEMNGSGTYDVIPVRDDNDLEGVSTLDLIFIQKHILKILELNSPYKIIAADVNRDDKVSASDILQLRKLILGIYDKFPDNTSWRMVDKAYVFHDPKDPFRGFMPESYHIENLNSNMNIDWVGVKIGDVNSSYVTHAKDKNAENRSNNLSFSMNDMQLISGSNIIPVLASKDDQINGFQISIPVKDIENMYISSGTLNFNPDNYIYNSGMLNVSWHSPDSKQVKEGDVLFFIHMDAEKSNSLADVMISGVNKGLKPEYYGADLDANKLTWRIERADAGVFELYGNTPNPWNNETNIQFTLPEDGQVSLKVRDITGRVVYTHQQYGTKGDNTIRVASEQLGTSGIFLYDLMFGNEVKTNKMLNIK